MTQLYLSYSSGQLLLALMLLKCFFDMASLSVTITGHGICEHVTRVEERLERSAAKLCGPTTDGAPSMTGRTNGFIKKIDTVGAQDVFVSHCIIYYYY